MTHPPPPILVGDSDGLTALLSALAQSPLVGVDTESNSLHAYREQVCLIQFSTLTADYIVDPLACPDLKPLAPFFANPDQQKVFHAAEYDIVCLKRDYGFEFVNIFDTMIGARTLGWPQVGLAAILETHFGVKTNKRYQRADWKHRPLTSEQLDYARIDTHYLPALRDRQFQALTDTGRWPEAQEECARLARLVTVTPEAEPSQAAFWRVKGAYDLTPVQAAVLRELFTYRERQAERADRPPFKVMGNETLIELARRAPCDVEGLQGVHGMTPDQISRHTTALLDAVQRGLRAPAERPPRVEREPDDVRDRYDRLCTWRKQKAKARGVESDVIVPRTTLWDLARRPPHALSDLSEVVDLGPWRRKTYGEEILALLSRAAPPSSK